MDQSEHCFPTRKRENAAMSSRASGSARHTSVRIGIAMILGITVGLIVFRVRVTAGYADLVPVVDWTLSVASNMFLRLIRMVVAPLVLLSLTAGIAQMGSSVALGRIAAKAFVWFIGMSAVSLTLGLAAAHLLQPGMGVRLVSGDLASPVPPAHVKSLSEVLVGAIPISIFDALARNDLLQVVVFAIFAGLALSRMPSCAPLVELCRQGAKLMLELTRRVMWFAPFAVFATLAETTARNGPAMLLVYGRLIGSFYLALLALASVIALVSVLFLKREFGTLLKAIRAPVLLAFSTASSEAAFAPATAALTRVGVPPQLVAFILPLGYSFNVDGTMMFGAFGVMFIAQVFGVALSVTYQLEILLLVFIMSKGAAGVPRGALVALGASLEHFHLPHAGLLLLLSVDQLMDMGRTGLNVFSNCCVTAVIARNEKDVDIDRGEPAGFQEDFSVKS